MLNAPLHRGRLFMTRESKIETYLVKRVTAEGGEVRKVAWIGRRNAPDRRVMRPNRLPVWVELKAPKKGLTRAQKREHERMVRLGENVHVIKTIGQVDHFMEFGYV